MLISTLPVTGYTGSKFLQGEASKDETVNNASVDLARRRATAIGSEMSSSVHVRFNGTRRALSSVHLCQPLEDEA